MKFLKPALYASGVLLILLGVAIYFLQGSGILPPALDPDTYTIDVTDYNPPAPSPAELLADDKIADKNPKFDPARIDRRPIGDWLINSSAAVLKLDASMLKPDHDAKLLTLYPSYRAAVEAAKAHERWTQVLPSINLIDGKAKQFDDGLYAAIDQAYYKGMNKSLVSHVDLFKRLFDKLGPDGPASAYVAAGLHFADVDLKVKDESTKASLIQQFERNPTASKPIAFYAWNKTLTDCFRVLRYFQAPISPDDTKRINALVDAFKSDPALLADYRKVIAFYSKLTNPTLDVSIADFVDGKTEVNEGQTLSILPESTSRETELFAKLFPLGLPPNADLMRELITGIRSGKIDLKPQANSGWYDYQVHALETFLLPQNGEGSDHLLLTKSYKERMVEAFKALMTKRRETHSRQAKTAGAPTSPIRELENVEPRLRLEPSPSYYHRTARAYGFLANFLEASIGANDLKTLHGLKEGGERKPNLHEELISMRDLFYGFYLLSSEDIGHAPEFANGETVDRTVAEKLASDWLASWQNDEDLAVDTRVSVPIFNDLQTRKTRLWATLGIRLARLEASYEKGPKVRPAAKDSAQKDWKDVESYKLQDKHYLIAVDEFAEVDLPLLDVLTRAELRAVCDAQKTKEAIITRLNGK